MKKQKHQPAIIEINCIEGDNEMSFAVRGSLEWLNEVMPFVMFGAGTITARVWKDTNEAERQELVDGINALQRHESYQGQFVKVTIAQEKPQ